MTETPSQDLMSSTFRRRGGVDGRSSICGYDTPRAPFFHQYARLPADDFVPAPAHSHHNKPPPPQDDTGLSRLPFVYNAITSRRHPQLRTRTGTDLIDRRAELCDLFQHNYRTPSDI